MGAMLRVTCSMTPNTASTGIMQYAGQMGEIVLITLAMTIGTLCCMDNMCFTARCMDSMHARTSISSCRTSSNSRIHT